MKDVIAEITAENLELKKRFRARGPREDAAGVAAAGPRGGEADEAAEWLAGGEDALGVTSELGRRTTAGYARRHGRGKRERSDPGGLGDIACGRRGELLERPDIRSDNGSCYISREFGAVLDEHELSHRRIKPHCPEENGLMERANRTIGEALEGEELTDFLQAVKVIDRLIRWYNEERLHSALGFLRPADYYRGNPEAMYAVRRQKLTEARHRRREKNLQLRQRTLPLTSEETVA